MKQDAIRLLTFGGIAVCLCSCSGFFWDSPSGSLSKTHAGYVNSGFASAARVSLTEVDAGPELARRETIEDCLTTSPETPTDGDGDGIPETQTVTLSCSEITTDDGTADMNGTITAEDKDDTSPIAGYRFEFDVSGGTSDGGTGTFEGFFDLSRAESTYTYETNYKTTTSTTGRAASNTEFGHRLNFTFTPDDAESPMDGGSITLGGFYRYLDTGTNAVDVVLSITSENLKYDGTNCANFFKEGSYTLTDGENNKVKTTFTDCTTKTTTYNDEAL